MLLQRATVTFCVIKGIIVTEKWKALQEFTLDMFVKNIEKTVESEDYMLRKSCEKYSDLHQIVNPL